MKHVISGLIMRTNRAIPSVAHKNELEHGAILQRQIIILSVKSSALMKPDLSTMILCG